ncbi:MAG: bis(5'-nucleosyl)-tetraphosphatase (symmetrical) YqeK [Spirochaetales bacterium]|nr:bis(5'-nucleosyl)-tetraphosphatase (symmetrical) YqeK [Spirochaetales bacterium]
MNRLSDIYLYLHRNLSRQRFIHCVSTAACARVLAAHFHMDDEIPFFAGLVHDIAREMDENTLTETVQAAAPEGCTAFYFRHPVMLHSWAGALLLEREFGIEDRSLLEAVKWHCCGHPLMDENAKIVYIADYIESTRNHIALKESEKVFSMELDEALFFILQKETEYYNKKDTVLCPDWKKLYNQLERNRRKGQ